MALPVSSSDAVAGRYIHGMKKILLLGGTGFLGRAVCEEIERLRWHATVPTRRLSNAQPVLMLPAITPLEADVHDEAALARLLPGHDAVVNLIGVLHGDEARFDSAHVQLPASVARACLAAGVHRLVHLSALGADADGPSMYQRSKARGEAALAALVPAGLALTLLRPSVVFGREDQFLNTFARLQRIAPFIPLACADAKFQPVWVQDVASAIVKILGNDRTAGQTFEACGPSVWTLQQLVELTGRLTGHARRVIPISMKNARRQAWLMEKLPGEPMLSNDNLDSMQQDNVASGALPGLRELGIDPAEIGPVLRGYLGGRSVESRLLDLRKTAGRF